MPRKTGRKATQSELTATEIERQIAQLAKEPTTAEIISALEDEIEGWDASDRKHIETMLQIRRVSAAIGIIRQHARLGAK